MAITGEFVFSLECTLVDRSLDRFVPAGSILRTADDFGACYEASAPDIRVSSRQVLIRRCLVVPPSGLWGKLLASVFRASRAVDDIFSVEIAPSPIVGLQPGDILLASRDPMGCRRGRIVRRGASGAETTLWSFEDPPSSMLSQRAP